MMTYRFATGAPQPAPPVKIYKWIAISFLALTAILLVVVVFMLSKKTTIMVVAKEDVKSVELSVRLVPKANGTGAIAGLVTTTVFRFSQTFQPTGTKTVSGAAKGSVIIYNKSGQEQALIKTTRLITASGVLFRLSDRVLVPANGQVEAAVYADQSGAAAQIGPSTFTIPGLSSERQKVVFAASKTAMTGGETRVGVLAATDIDQAKQRYKDRVVEAFLESTSSTVSSGVARLATANISEVTSDQAVGEEVGAFTLSGTSTITLVTYAQNDLADLLEDAVGAKIDAASEKVLSLDSRPRVTLKSADAPSGTAELSVKQNVAVTLDASGTALSPRNFVGRSKDDIERYLMGLDHVYTVDVSFSPSWITTAPSVPDRVKVIVKSIK